MTRVSKEKQKLKIMMEGKATETYLCMQRFSEATGKDIRQKIVDLIAGFTDEQPYENNYYFD